MSRLFTIAMAERPRRGEGGQIAAAPAGAVTYDAYTSFAGVQGAGGFVYGYTNSISFGDAFDVTAGGAACPYFGGGGGTCLYSSASPDGNIPVVQKGGTFPTVTLAGARLYAHPGNNSNFSVAGVFTAPTAGTYTYSINLQSIGTDTTNDIGYRLVSFVGPTPTFGARSVLASYLDTGSLTGSINLTGGPGSGGGFVIDYNGNYGGDSPAVDFTVTSAAVPEPASWALLALGFGLTGAALRTRRRSVAAA